LGERSAEKVPLEKLTRFYLLNHFLWQKADKHDIADVVGDVCGLHAQAPSTPIDRSQVYRPVVGDVAACLLIDGRVAGTWSWKRTRKRLAVIVRPFRKLGRGMVAETKQVVKEPGAFLNVGETELLVDQ
jgi:hypothetical protein